MKHTSGKRLGKDDAFYYLWEFDSIRELADYAADNPQPRLTSDRESKPDFNTTASFDEAYTLAVDGWHAIRDSVDAHLVPLRERLGDVLSTVREHQYDIIGYEPDIDRYLDGELECMLDDVYTEQLRNGKVFTLLVDSSLVWNNDADDVAKRGATLCALVEAFSMLGFQLEIYGEWTWKGQGHSKYASVLTRFNNAGEPIDIDSMMFALGSPDWFRRIGFAMGENTPELHNKFGFDGKYYGLNGNGSHHADRVGASAVVSIEGNRPMVDNPVRWILDQLEAQGVIDSEDL